MKNSQQHRFAAVAIVSVLYGLVLLGVLLSGCQSASDGENAEPDGGTEQSVTASMGEWYINIDGADVTEGTVTFRVTNAGSIRHEFLVVKTELAPGLIPVGADARFDETNSEIDIVADIAEWGSGFTKSVSVDLAAGDYQLVCNLPGHYRLGMWTPLSVGQ